MSVATAETFESARFECVYLAAAVAATTLWERSRKLDDDDLMMMVVMLAVADVVARTEKCAENWLIAEHWKLSALLARRFFLLNMWLSSVFVCLGKFKQYLSFDKFQVHIKSVFMFV